MRKLIITGALLAIAGQAGAATIALDMVAVNQRSSSGSLSTLKWSGCTTYTSTTGCINPANGNLAAMGITPSTAVWSWNDATGVLSSVGAFNSASTLGSSGNAVANTVIGDKVTNLVIDTVNDITTASSYQCAEGTFLAGVGANGCLNTLLGDDGVSNSSALYNVGGNANCIQRTLGGDDTSTGNPRGLMSAAAAGSCDAVDGAFNLWTVVSNTIVINGNSASGQLILSNGVPLTSAGTSYLTFNATSVVPVPGAVWLLGSALGLLGVARRRLAA